MKYKRIICVGAHPLDAELMGGPLMIKYAKEGAHCTFVHVTAGRLESPTATKEEKEAYHQKLIKEYEDVAKTMECDCNPLEYVSSELPSQDEFTKLLIDYFEKEKADLIITHARGTLHPRHYYTYETVTDAVRKMREKGSKIRLLYGENCEDLIGFIPTTYVSMSNEIMEQWFEGLSKYSIFQGKVNDMPYQDYYRSMAKVRAVEAFSKLPVKAYMNGGLIDDE